MTAEPIDHLGPTPETMAHVLAALPDPDTIQPAVGFDLEQFEADQAAAVAKTSAAHRRWLARIGPALHARAQRLRR